MMGARVVEGRWRREGGKEGEGGDWEKKLSLK